MTAQTADQAPDVVRHFQGFMDHLLECNRGCGREQYCDEGRELRRALRDAKTAARSLSDGGSR